MRSFRTGSFVAIVLGLSLSLSSQALAEDTKGKWQFGFGISYYSTVDYIRSNADIALAEGVVGDNGLPSVGSVDERPDINIQNEASIRDDFKLDFNASYGLTRWLALETGVSYMSASVGNIEFYTRNVHQGVTSQTNTLVSACGPDPSSPGNCWQWTPQQPDEIRNNNFLPVGTITEIPIHLSGLIRFRPESPFDPYIGVGFGYIIADLSTGDDFNKVASGFSDPNFTVSVASEGEFTVNGRCNREGFPIGIDCTEFHPKTLEANVSDTWEWHAIGGVDYYTSEHFSVYVDARYYWTSGSVDIRTDRAHQVRFAVDDSGTLILATRRYKNATPGDPFGPGDPASGDFLWEDTGVPANQAFHTMCPECQGNGTLETEDKNQNGSLDDRCDPNIPNDFCEDEGTLYRLPPGSRDVNESMKMTCPDNNHDGVPDCAHNHILDTEDANNNGYLDRYIVYGYDICTTDRAAGNPRCGCGGPGQPACPTNNNNVTYIWPQGCPQNEQQIAPYASLTETGCPPFAPIDPTSGTRQTLGTTVADDAADTVIIQGGRIRMGGFGLGIGFKFTF